MLESTPRSRHYYQRHRFLNHDLFTTACPHSYTPRTSRWTNTIFPKFFFNWSITSSIVELASPRDLCGLASISVEVFGLMVFITLPSA